MTSSKKRRQDLINVICRICAREDLTSIPIFGEVGKKQNIAMKMRACLPVIIQENDNFPKQICLACLTKLDSFWDMHETCKEAQTKIEKKLYSLVNQENGEKSHLPPVPIEEKLKKLSESYPVSYGDSAVICLTRESPPTMLPPPATTAVPSEGQLIPQPAPVEPVLTPITYISPNSVSSIAPASEEALLQNSGEQQTVVYHSAAVPITAPATVPTTAAGQRRRAPLIPMPQPMASPMPAATTPQQTISTLARRPTTETPLSNGPRKESQWCKFCKKYFSDDIIDHHINLHYRQSFSSCVECGKNFRSEEAMEKHRCNGKNDEPIDLDADDDDLMIVSS